MSPHCQTHHTVSKCIENQKVPKVAPMPAVLYEKKPTWLHFTALIIKSYMHWEVQNILIPLCHILKRIFYILLWFESQREKNHYITGILFTSPTFLSFYKTFLCMVISLGNDLFTTNYYSYTCRSMNEDHLFSSLAFYFVKPFQYMEKWRPWCFQGFAKRVGTNT